MTSCSAVVFDIGNVLLEWNPECFFDTRIGVERRSALFSEVDLAGMNLRIDAGAPFDDTLNAMIAAHPEWAAEIALWRDNWIDMLGPEITPSIEILRRLRDKGVPVFALSNFGTQTFQWAKARYPFLTEFDQTFISGQLKTVKPEEKIYQILEDQTPTEPNRLFFIDDRPENISAAVVRGWQGHVFQGVEGLRDALRVRGLAD